MEDVKGKRVVVGMSGGVDSSVAAYLLKEAGADVHGVFMKNWEEEFDQGFCTVEDDLKDAELVCNTLSIPLHKVNFAKNYKERVFSYFIKTLKDGLTPNPDVLCNKEIKFKAFLDYAHELGADFLATGHYAKIRRKESETYLIKALDQNKDQTYFLHLLDQSQLKNVLFPIGNYTKKDVREIALKNELITYDKKDSTGICFIGERDFNQFLMDYLPIQPGEMITPDGDIVGEHQGLAFYTIGQRQGLKIGGRKDSNGKPWFVADKILEQNKLLVVQGGNHEALMAKELIAKDIHWINANNDTDYLNQSLKAKIRYRQQDEPCKIKFLANNRLHVFFERPQRAITPGQAIVFYKNDVCLGGAVIEMRVKQIAIL